MQRRYPASLPFRATPTARGCTGYGPSHPAGNPAGSGSSPQPSPRLPRRHRSALARSWPAGRSAGNGQDSRARALRRRLCPSDEPLRHSVGNRRRIAASLGALGPDLLEPHGNTLNALADEARVSIAEIFRADVDDAARVDHIVGRIEDATLMDALAVIRRCELVVC